MRTLLMIVREDEAEPIVVETDGERIVLELDDGDTINLDRAELLAAIFPSGTEILVRTPPTAETVELEIVGEQIAGLSLEDN